MYKNGSHVPRFYFYRGKRLIDIVVSGISLFILAPLFILIAVSIKLSSKGTVFYRQIRVGKGGENFQILKFRSMKSNTESLGSQITISGDSRITPIGKILRKFKLDELPQFWNVFIGNMSLVGPRPELPCYVEEYTDEQRRVLNIRPGITDIASIAYRNEEKMLALSPEPEKFYRSVVLPHKLTLNLQYISRVTFRNDLSLIGKTILAIFSQHITQPIS